MVALALALALQVDAAAELLRLRRDARDLLAESHRLLDRGDYEKAVDAHRRGRGFEARARETLDRAVAGLLPGLDDDRFEAREAASSRLLTLGPALLPKIDALLRGDVSAEVRARLQDVARRVKGVEEDADGRFRQWAEGASASSEYEADRWSAAQATGRPDTPEGGDRQTAWASKDADGGEEWLELRYALEVRPVKIRVHETYNPGAVVKAEAWTSGGTWQVLWRGAAAVREGEGWFTIDVPPGAPATRAIRLTIDSAAVSGWNEIDAVELIGEP
ncbi:MAG TPA: hypothetical protein VF950_24655 [Planctomycetota bacterium]